MADTEVKTQTFKEKILFKITAFFVLLGTFSLFAFLFLVPFIIDPAFTTIFMQFDTSPALCETIDVIFLKGTKNCTWSSCREGCTREMYNCTQISVRYISNAGMRAEMNLTDLENIDNTTPAPPEQLRSSANLLANSVNNKIRGVYSFDEEEHQHGGPIEWSPDWIDRTSPHKLSKRDTKEVFEDNKPDTKLDYTITADTNFTFPKAKLLPNVKGCGYPPSLNCSIFFKKYRSIGTTYPCYFSKVDPYLVITQLDMRQVYLNLILATTIPIPSFIISVIYLAFAYFVIYAEDPPEINTNIPQDGEEGETQEVDEEEDNDGELPPQTENKTLSLEDGLPDIDADIEDIIEADELPIKENPQTPPNDNPPAGELIKPAAMMVVRPNSLQPIGPIAAV